MPKESKEEKVLKEINNILKKYITDNDNKEVCENLSEGTLKDNIDDKVLNKLIHNQHSEYIKHK